MSWFFGVVVPYGPAEVSQDIPRIVACTDICCNSHNPHPNQHKPLGHCPLHHKMMMAGWCSECDLEVVWASQREHLCVS
jgi:hypothetical protein